MDGYIKILGVSVGMHESDAIKILSAQNIKVGRNKACVYTEGLVCSGENIQINYSLKDFKVSKISIHWSLINKGRLNTREEELKIYTIGKKAYDYILGMNTWEYNEKTTYDGKIRITTNTMIDLYNKVYISKQYKTAVDSINHVGIHITDINEESIDKNEFEYLRVKYTFENKITPSNEMTKKEDKPTKAANYNLWFKIAIVVILFVVGFLFVQNNRYYYTNKGRVMVDKWTKEYFYLNTNGEYIKE